MTDLFSRANSIGLSCIRQWLPDGRQDGHEWIARNPTRHDEHIGSFRINTDSGVWSDFATGDSGADPVSLYAYLNQFECESRADSKQYKNRDGGIQAEAARAILEKYDPGYFPSDGDNFEPKYTKKRPSSESSDGYWSGWHILENGVDNPPEFDPSYHVQYWGEILEKWYFENERGNVVMAVARFKKEGEKKNDRPFTLWTNGKETKWRAKSLGSILYPLWGLVGIFKNQTFPILLCEGQKAASRAAKILSEKYCCVGWYGGAGSIEKTDLKPLTGRTIYFWPDEDQAGRKVILKLKELECNVTVIHAPAGAKQGWDIADAIEEGWTVERLTEKIETKESNFAEDAETFPVRVLGLNGDRIWLYGRIAERAEQCSKKSLNKGFLLTVARRNAWAMYYSYDGRMSWDAAIDDLLGKAEKMPDFDENKIRRCGAWWDNGKIIINTGSKIIENGSEKSLSCIESEYVYERSRNIPYNTNDSMDVKDSSKLLDVINHLPFDKEIYRQLLAGWLLLVPWGGILKWRPHVWITGKKGVGKSWIIGNIVQPVVLRWAISGSGSSTPAGWKQAMKNCSLGIIADEAEGENWKQSEAIEQFLKMLREGSSGEFEEGLSTLQGTPDGEGRRWQLNSIALLASIGAILEHGPDADRFTLLNLKSDGDNERFKRLEKASELFTPLWVESFHSRTYKIIDELLNCIDVLVERITEETGIKRTGDQYGTLLAGAWMVSHDKAILASEASEWIQKIGLFEILSDREEMEDEQEILNEMFAYKIIIQKEYIKTNISIGRALQEWFALNSVSWINREVVPEMQNCTKDTIKEALEQIGIKPTKYKDEWICIAKNHPSIKKILQNTAYKYTYYQILKRSRFADETECQGSFSGINTKYLRLKAQEILEEIPI